MRTSWIVRGALNLTSRVPIRDKTEGHQHSGGYEGGHMKMEAEAGAMQPQAKERGPPGASRGEGGSSPRDFRGIAALLMPRFHVSGLQNYKGISRFVVIYFFSKNFIHETYTHRGRDPGRGRSRLHAGSPMWDSIPGPRGHALS